MKTKNEKTECDNKIEKLSKNERKTKFVLQPVSKKELMESICLVNPDKESMDSRG